MPEDLKPEDIIAGHTYRGKKFKPPIGNTTDDRTILWISKDKLEIQYDSPMIVAGKLYKTITMGKFLKWAKEDVTNK